MIETDVFTVAMRVLDEAEVPKEGRMIWDGPGGPMAIEDWQRAFLDTVVFGTGMWKHGLDRAVHIGARTIYKPQTPAEVDAFVERLIADDVETRWRGTWRLSRLSTALLAAYP